MFLTKSKPLDMNVYFKSIDESKRATLHWLKTNCPTANITILQGPGWKYKLP